MRKKDTIESRLTNLQNNFHMLQTNFYALSNRYEAFKTAVKNLLLRYVTGRTETLRDLNKIKAEYDELKRLEDNLMRS